MSFIDEMKPVDRKAIVRSIVDSNIRSAIAGTLPIATLTKIVEEIDILYTKKEIE